MIMSCRLTVKELSGDNSLCSPNADLEKPASCGSGTPFSEQTVVPEFVFLAPPRRCVSQQFISYLNLIEWRGALRATGSSRDQHSTSLMPTRVIEATERIARKQDRSPDEQEGKRPVAVVFNKGARRSVSFMSAYDNASSCSFHPRFLISKDE